MESLQSAKGLKSQIRQLRTVPDWSLVGDRVHVVQFYEHHELLLDLLSRFAGTALVTGDSAVVIATRRHRRGLEQRLRARGFDPGVARKQGRYLPVDAAQTLTKILYDGRPDAARFSAIIGTMFEAAAKAAEVSGRQRVAAFSEIVALLWAQGNVDEALRLEELWNRLAETYAFSLCCAYPMSGFLGNPHAVPFLKICAQHSHVFPAERRARAVAASF